MNPPPLLTENEHHMLDALACMLVLDHKEAKQLMWFLPLEGRAWGCARGICGYTKFPLDRFSKAVANKKLANAYKTLLLIRSWS